MPTARARLCSLAVAVSCVLLASAGHAQLDLGRFVRASEPSAAPRSAVPVRGLSRVLAQSVSAIVEVPAGGARPPRFVPIGPTDNGAELGVLSLAPAAVAELSRTRPDLRLFWSPPLRLAMDRADAWVHASGFRNATGASGRGVLVGIVDTGIDPTHADFRDENGRTRIRYWLDFSRERAGLQPELEDALACRTTATDDSGAPCAVFSGKDLQDLIENSDPNDDPHDPLGHGTHVASLAVGNGRASVLPRYAGVAPAAEIVVVRVLRSDGGIYDADVLKAARFVFDRADELGMPAVVNLSLGNDFGGHDGSSAIERGLASMVGPEHQGRAIVVAAGNSASLYEGLDTGAPEPLGVHTQVHVPAGADAVVPLITPVMASGIEGTLYVWVATRPGDELAIGVDDAAGPVIQPVLPGAQTSKQHGAAEIVVVNGAGGADSPIPAGTSGAVVLIDGSWPSNQTFGLRLEGPATAQIWVMGAGALSPEQSIGPLVPRATKAGTINIPGSSPALIAVGATWNRTTWPDVAGELVSFLDPAPEDSLAFFSSAGPNAVGTLKPDLVAPGANVIGALARTADPRGVASSSFFADTGECVERGYSPHCFVADPGHALTSGTSMAAPLVTGAVALLFERDPSLDQTRVRALLQAGARRPEGFVFSPRQAGPGVLDLERTLEALAAGDAARLPGNHTEITLADAFVHPDPSWPLEGLVAVRDDAGRIADGFAESRLTLQIGGDSGAHLVETPQRLAPGLYRFRVAAPAGSGGRVLSLAVRFDARVIASTVLPVAVDPALASEAPAARGGCGLTTAKPPAGAPFVFGLTALLVLGRRRRRARSLQSSTKYTNAACGSNGATSGSNGCCTSTCSMCVPTASTTLVSARLTRRASTDVSRD
jgi:MYXO-CTERM domain-containing protein